MQIRCLFLIDISRRMLLQRYKYGEYIYDIKTLLLNLIITPEPSEILPRNHKVQSLFCGSLELNERFKHSHGTLSGNIDI